MKMKGLGRGLDALLAGNSSAEQKPGDEQRTLPVTLLQPGKYQPRTHMDDGALHELAASIRAQGIMQPILVRRLAGGVLSLDADRYEIIAGERRWRAAQLAELGEVPVLIRDIPDEQALAMSLIENIQRENLNPLEEAQGLQRLVDEFGLTHQQAADAVGRSRPAASNLLRLLQLSAPVQEMLMTGQLDMGHARALLPLPGAEQVMLAQRIVQQELSVREAEHLVQQSQMGDNSPEKAAKKPEAAPVNRDLLRLEEALADALGTSVSLRANRKGKGRLSIEFASLDQLDGILSQIRNYKSI